MNYKHCCVIDADGYYQTFVRVLLPEDAVPQVQGYILQNGESLLDTVAPTNPPYAGAIGLVRPKWDDPSNAWVEGATAEEIAAWEAEHPAPHAKTLAEVQTAKLAEINAACDAAITAGCDVTLSDGTAGHISLSIPDQINLTTAREAVKAGGSGYAYHLDGSLCEVYPAADIAIMAKAATAHILYHQTYCNHARTWAKRCTAVADVQAITYGAALPDDLATHMAAVIAAAGGGNA
ncbi:DUF4376 domain-containing protein [Oscillibacter ruminantium]|uniref:DUF4376 domain-containing protein n=1 Tax=Oscillibacter ruminantium TaxID=1263547 RepID=UPI000685E44A|nr:hypothetical protein [Oscillibacter ruminantium]